MKIVGDVPWNDRNTLQGFFSLVLVDQNSNATWLKRILLKVFTKIMMIGKIKWHI